MSDSLHSIVSRADGSLAIWCQNHKTCVKCGREHFFFISRDGRTVCYFCDEMERQRLTRTVLQPAGAGA